MRIHLLLAASVVWLAGACVGTLDESTDPDQPPDDPGAYSPLQDDDPDIGSSQEALTSPLPVLNPLNGWSVAASAFGPASGAAPPPEVCSPLDEDLGLTSQHANWTALAPSFHQNNGRTDIHFFNDHWYTTFYDFRQPGASSCGSSGSCEGRLRADLRAWDNLDPASGTVYSARDLLRASAVNFAYAQILFLSGQRLQGDEDDYGLGRALAELAVTGRTHYEQFSSDPRPAWQGGIWQWGFPSELDILEDVRADLLASGYNVSENLLWWACTRALDRAYRTSAFIMGRSNDRDGTRENVNGNIADLNGWTGRFWAVSAENDPPHRPVNVPATPFPQYSMTVQVTNPISPSLPKIPIKVRYSIAHAWSRVNNSTTPPAYAGFDPNTRPENDPAGYHTTGATRILTSDQIGTKAYSFAKGQGGYGYQGQTCLGVEQFPIKAGKRYTVSTCGRYTGDTWLRVNRWTNGALLCQNDDVLGACGYGSECTFVAPTDDTAIVCESTYGYVNSSWQYVVTSNEPKVTVPTTRQCVTFLDGPRVISCPEGATPFEDTNAGVAATGSRVKQILQIGPDAYAPNTVPTGPGPFVAQGRTVPKAPTPVLEWDAAVIVFIHGSGSNLEESMALTEALHKLALGDGSGPLRRNYTVLSVDLPGGAYSENIDSRSFAPWDCGLGTPLDGTLGTWADCAGLEGRPHGCGGNGTDCADFFTGGGHNAPILKFDENFVVDFLNQLDAQLGADSITGKRLKDKLVAVVGGSLGGNLAFKMGRDDPSVDPRYAILPPNVVPWSVAGTPFSAGDGDGNWTLNHRPLSTLFVRAGIRVPGGSDNSVETPNARSDFFFLKFDAPANTIAGPSNPAYWYSDSFPCKQTSIAASRLATQETYNRNTRTWHWRLSGDELLYSHQQAGTATGDIMGDPSPGTFNYRFNFRNMLLIAGNDDNHAMLAQDRIWWPGCGNCGANGSWTCGCGEDSGGDKGWGYYTGSTSSKGLNAYVSEVAKRMYDTPGRFRLLGGVGHSVHFERPLFLAREMESFLDLRQWDPLHPGASPCLGGRNSDGSEFTPSINEIWDWGTSTRQMVGCDNKAFWPSTCNYGYHVCTAWDWQDRSSGQHGPAAHYWTDSNLNWSGNGSGNCMVTDVGGNVSNCGTNVPMKICADGMNDDGHGSFCTWTSCGLGTTTNQHFGGCGGSNVRAGTMCCKN